MGKIALPLNSIASIFDQIPDYRNSVIVARNPGSAKKATSYAERLRLGIAVIHGEQKEAESDEIDGRYSPPTLPWSVFLRLHMNSNLGFNQSVIRPPSEFGTQFPPMSYRWRRTFQLGWNIENEGELCSKLLIYKRICRVRF